MEVTEALCRILPGLLGAGHVVERESLRAALRDRLRHRLPDLTALDACLDALPARFGAGEAARLITPAAPAAVVRDTAPDRRWEGLRLPPSPHCFPYADGGCLELHPDGSYRYDVSHLGYPAGAPRFSWPRIHAFEVAGRLEAGDVHATVITGCESLDPIMYRYVAYFFRGDDHLPAALIAAETNAEMSADKKYENVVYIGLFTRQTRQNLGLFAGLTGLEPFLRVAAMVAADVLDLRGKREGAFFPAGDRLAEIRTGLAEADGPATPERLAAARRLLTHVAYGADRKLAYDAAATVFTLAMELGETDAALSAAALAIDLDQRTAVTSEADEYGFPRTRPLRPGPLLFRLCREGRLTEAAGLARASMRLNLTPRPRRFRTGLASAPQTLDSDIEDELLIIGAAGLATGYDSAITALRVAARRSEISFHTAGLAAACALLAVAAEGEERAAAATRAVECALLADDPALLRAAVVAAGQLAPARGDRVARRSALEAALVREYGRLSDRLAVSTMLAGVPLSDKAGAALHRAAAARAAFLGEAEVACTPAAWLQHLAGEAARGRCRPIGHDDLDRLTVSTPEGDFHWTDFPAVNTALADLGSALRLATMTGVDGVLAAAAALVDVPPAALPVDAGFLLGEVGPVTATPLAPLADFVSELAISPAMPADEAGYVFDNVVVLRGSAVRPADEQGWTHALVHELVHVLGYTNARRHSFALGCWLRHVTQDVLRLCRTGCDRATLAAALAPNFENVVVWSDQDGFDFHQFLGVDLREFLRHRQLDSIVASMLAGGVLTKSDGRLHAVAGA